MDPSEELLCKKDSVLLTPERMNWASLLVF